MAAIAFFHAFFVWLNLFVMLMLHFIAIPVAAQHCGWPSRRDRSRGISERSGPSADQTNEVTMSELIKAFGRRVRRSFRGINGVSEEEYLAHAVDRIDLELSMREYDRHRSSSRRVLGGACRV